jgi:hypothetical protein
MLVIDIGGTHVHFFPPDVNKRHEILKDDE